jgi:hypothetical protein
MKSEFTRDETPVASAPVLADQQSLVLRISDAYP